MKRDIKKLSTNEIVDMIEVIGIQQYEAKFESNYPLFRRLLAKQWKLEDELKSRHNDERHALVKHFSHPIVQVRLNAANAVYALMPKKARGVLEEIANGTEFPFSADAAMCIGEIDAGRAMYA